MENTDRQTFKILPDLSVESSGNAIGLIYKKKLAVSKAGKPFTEGLFLNYCILQVTDILCPDKQGLFNNISLLANTVAEQIIELSSDIHKQFQDKAQSFTAYSVVKISD